MRKHLLDLDQLRFQDPAEALRQTLEAVDNPAFPRTLLPLALGVTGSALRMQVEYDAAAAVLSEGLAFADALGDHATAGNLHQRLSMVWWNRLEYQRAYDENCRAMARHLEADNPEGIAQTFVDRGIFLGSMGKFEWSNRAFELGLEGLAPRDHRNRATALCGLFHNLLELDQIHEALPYLRTAEALPLDPRNRAKMMWMNGLALSKSNLHEEALAYLEAAVGQLEQVAPIDGALAAIDLIHTLLLTGKPAHAHRKAREMISFMIPLSEKKAAQAALIELSNLGLRGVGLTLDLLERVRSEITPLAEFNTL